MNLHLIDISIIVAYLAATVGVGFWVSQRASKNLKGYFLGGNNLPWYALGMSNASGMFDVAGTMWMVSLLFVYGVKSVFIPWLWPVFNQIFLMAFLAIWLRRSGVMTGAEWITFRFGDNVGARLSHLVIVLFALITVLGYIAYGFLGIGKLAAEFLPFELHSAAGVNEKIYALIIVGLTTLYVIKGGMYSVVLTEVMQFFLMCVACTGIAIVAMTTVSQEQLAAAIPLGWDQLRFGKALELDWSQLIPAADQKIASDGYSLFSIFVLLALFKGVFQSLAGPAPNYDMQRVLATRTPRDAALMSAFVNVVLLAPRYAMIAGLGILSLVFFTDALLDPSGDIDFEAVLPFALSNFVPVGLLGIVLAGLLAAFMSSFAAALNAAPAYLVNDIYKRYINETGSDRLYVRLSWITSILFVVIGSIIGVYLQSINDIVLWLTSGLFGGYTGANVLKWIWWRLNGYGYFAGMSVGVAFALMLSMPAEASPFVQALDWLYNGVFRFGVAKIDPLNAFPVFFTVCLFSSIAASLVTPPDDREVLVNFFKKTRPWGFWGPVVAMAADKGDPIQPNHDFVKDMMNVVVGIVWQTAIMASATFLVIKSFDKALIAALIVILTTVILKFSWYDRLPEDSKSIH